MRCLFDTFYSRTQFFDTRKHILYYGNFNAYPFILSFTKPRFPRKRKTVNESIEKFRTNALFFKRLIQIHANVQYFKKSKLFHTTAASKRRNEERTAKRKTDRKKCGKERTAIPYGGDRGRFYSTNFRRILKQTLIYTIEKPPLTGKSIPVIYSFSSKYKTALATSSELPILPIGTSPCNASSSSFEK